MRLRVRGSIVVAVVLFCHDDEEGQRLDYWGGGRKRKVPEKGG